MGFAVAAGGMGIFWPSLWPSVNHVSVDRRVNIILCERAGAQMLLYVAKRLKEAETRASGSSELRGLAEREKRSSSSMTVRSIGGSREGLGDVRDEVTETHYGWA